MSTRTAPKPGPDPYADTPPGVHVWTVTSQIMDRSPKGQNAVVIKVRVSELRCNGKNMTTLEGPNSDRLLQDLADGYNASNKPPLKHRRAFADMPPTARAKTSAKHYQTFVGPGFDPQPIPETPNTTPNETL